MKLYLLLVAMISITSIAMEKHPNKKELTPQERFENLRKIRKKLEEMLDQSDPQADFLDTARALAYWAGFGGDSDAEYQRRKALYESPKTINDVIIVDDAGELLEEEALNKAISDVFDAAADESGQAEFY